MSETIKGLLETIPLFPSPLTELGDRPFLVKRLEALAALRSMPGDSVNMFNFDLPYESLEKHRAWGTTTRLKQSKKSSNDWFGIFKNELFPALFAELFRVAAKNSHHYAWCDDETSDFMKFAAQAAGFKVWKRLIWDKVHFGMGYHYRAQYEFILFFEKGKHARLKDLGVGDVIRSKRIKHKDAYPAEKPVDVNELLTTQSTEPGDLICDPFMGSASAGVAALMHGRRFLGFDISQLAIDLGTIRCHEAVGVREAIGK